MLIFCISQRSNIQNINILTLIFIELNPVADFLVSIDIK